MICFQGGMQSPVCVRVCVTTKVPIGGGMSYGTDERAYQKEAVAGIV